MCCEIERDLLDRLSLCKVVVERVSRGFSLDVKVLIRQVYLENFQHGVKQRCQEV